MHQSYPDLIAKKRDGAALSPEEIQYFVEGVVSGSVGDVQTGAMLMAMYLRGLSSQEAASLTRTMLHSGSVLEWPEDMKLLMVDKHSTGGVGDKISLVLAPALAACGLKVPMISGRGLGFTGGTIDKLESIPGFRVVLSEAEAQDIIRKVGCFIMAQNDNIAPADKILYAARDVTATVDCIPLITASILSKKAAENLSCLLLDLKCGSAAFMKDLQKAKELAALMVNVGKELGIRMAVIITKMDVPLGYTIGNALEVRESVDTMRGRGAKDIVALVEVQGGTLLHLSGLASTIAEGEQRIHAALQDGSALAKFVDMLVAQGVDPAVAEDLCGNPLSKCLPLARTITELRYEGDDGFVEDICALELARISGALGASRSGPDGKINFGVGMELLVTTGDPLVRGQPWIKVHHDLSQLDSDHVGRLQRSIVSSKSRPAMRPLVIEALY